MNKTPTRIDKTIMAVFVTLFVTHNPIHPPHEHTHIEIVEAKKPKETGKHRWGILKMVNNHKL
jgi:hypothetical protein